ncbi:phospholipase D-like domain-containing protein [Paraburkholderia sp. J67]|uniref:phospholipase D-like domain-containing protein n=1 Tax=Paraburkholderia sp. J67 TaxID=2805435 RepID=UPI002ABD2B6D|nr:phospholipase D-like domain-containing protein [Paraburkholderia sp. J67]
MPIYYCNKCDCETETTSPWVSCSQCKSKQFLVVISREKQALNTSRREAAEREANRLKEVAEANREHNKLQPIGQLPDHLLEMIFDFFDERALALLTLVCHRWPPIIELIRQRYIPMIRAYGSTSGTLKDVLIGQAGLLRDKTSLQMAVDQFPYPASYKGSILKFILDTKMKVRLSLGTEDSRTIAILSKKENQAKLVRGFDKMHNKIWILDGKEIILGSPNVSFSGLEGGNLESFILIKSARLGALFGRYLKMLNDSTKASGVPRELFNEVRRDLGIYNSEPHGLKVALAPIINITDFVVEQLSGATKITVRQFLISHKHWKDRTDSYDIVDALADMARSGVDIDIVIDEGSFDKQPFVRQAARTLYKAGCNVYVQQPVATVATRETLMHDKLILAEMSGGVKRTLIGSAGFTTSVIENTNAESFVSIDFDHVFEDLMKHHRRADELYPMKQITWTA